jgi:hypothetical protein
MPTIYRRISSAIIPKLFEGQRAGLFKFGHGFYGHERKVILLARRLSFRALVGLSSKI